MTNRPKMEYRICQVYNSLDSEVNHLLTFSPSHLLNPHKSPYARTTIAPSNRCGSIIARRNKPSRSDAASMPTAGGNIASPSKHAVTLLVDHPVAPWPQHKNTFVDRRSRPTYGYVNIRGEKCLCGSDKRSAETFGDPNLRTMLSGVMGLRPNHVGVWLSHFSPGITYRVCSTRARVQFHLSAPLAERHLL